MEKTREIERRANRITRQVVFMSMVMGLTGLTPEETAQELRKEARKSPLFVEWVIKNATDGTMQRGDKTVFRKTVEALSPSRPRRR